MTDITPEMRTEHAAQLIASYSLSEGRTSHPLVEILCDLKYWAEADDIDFITKAREAERLYEKVQSTIVPVPKPHLVEFSVTEQYRVEVVALTPRDAIEAAKVLYATEGPRSAHGFVQTFTNDYQWDAEEVRS